MDRTERAEILSRLRRDARRIAERFGLEYKRIVAEDPRVKSRYGVCYQDGLIKIRLNHARTGEPLKYSSLIDTLCHELAHLRHFDHGSAFKAFFLRMLGWARRQGIYTPGPATGEAAAPAALPPLVLDPPRRNGVAVFPRDDSPTESIVPPWLAQPPSRAPEARPPARKPEQLSLF